MSFVADAFKKTVDAVTHPFDLNKGWDSIKSVDPVTPGLLKGVARAEDKLLGSMWGVLGNDYMAGQHKKDSEDSSRAFTHRIEAGLATLGAMAAGGAAAGGGAASGGGASAGGAGGTLGAGGAAGGGGVAAGGGGAAAGGAGAGAGGAAAGGSAWGAIGKAVAPVVASNILSAATAKKPQQQQASAAYTPAAMPDPLAQEQARKRALAKQMARRGRASTILTDSGDGGLGS